MKHMKAVVCTKYGPPEVLQLKEVEKPTPKENGFFISLFVVYCNLLPFIDVCLVTFLVTFCSFSYSIHL